MEDRNVYQLTYTFFKSCDMYVIYIFYQSHVIHRVWDNYFIV